MTAITGNANRIERTNQGKNKPVKVVRTNEEGSITMENSKEKLSHDGKANMWITITMGAINLIVLGTLAFIQPSLSTASNRADSNTVSIAKNEAILNEFKSNQEKHNESMEKKVDVLINSATSVDTKMDGLSNRVVSMESNISLLANKVTNMESQMKTVATKEDIANLTKILEEIRNKKK